MKKTRQKRSKVSKRNYDPALDRTKHQSLLREHIPYEADMLNGTYSLLQNSIDDVVTRNAIIESYSTHCRNLIRFLKNDDDVKATLFAPAFNPKDVCKGKHYIALISDQIAHLSTRRTSNPDEKIGPALWREMYLAISKHLQDFIDKIDTSHFTWTAEWRPLDFTQLPPGSSNATIHAPPPLISGGPTGPTGPGR